LALALVEADENDFAAWSKLLASVEEDVSAHAERVEPTFEAFLKRFPLCFGYWCKYADLCHHTVKVEVDAPADDAAMTDAPPADAAADTPVAAEADADAAKDAATLAADAAAAKVDELRSDIYHRALAAVPTSVELWRAYTAHVRRANEGKVSDPLRTAFKEAIAAVGGDQASQPLWDSYFEFEADRGTPENACDVLRAALCIDATGRTDELWKRFRILAKSYKITELVGEEDRTALLERYRLQSKAHTAADEDDQILAGRSAGMTELQEQRQLEQLLAEGERGKNEVVQRRIERQHLEAGVRRWYFHVKPLDEAQLDNWRQYLKLEHEFGTALAPPSAFGALSLDAATEALLAQQKTAATMRLYERCLVPCALYAEFWLSYVDWTRAHVGEDAALAVARRAAAFLPRRVDVLRKLALLLEAHGDVDGARGVFAAIAAHGAALLGDDAAPRRAACALLCCNFERRQGLPESVSAAYAAAGNDGAAPPAAVVAHKARYESAVLGKMAAARATLDGALERRPDDAGLWASRAQLEADRIASERPGPAFEAAQAVFEKALAPASTVPPTGQRALWARYLALADSAAHGTTGAALTVQLRRRYAKWRRTAAAAAAPEATPADADGEAASAKRKR